MLQFARYVEQHIALFNEVNHFDRTIPILPVFEHESDKDSLAKLQRAVGLFIKSVTNNHLSVLQQLEKVGLPAVRTMDPVLTTVKIQHRSKYAALCCVVYQLLYYRWKLHQKSCSLCSGKPEYPFCLTCFATNEDNDPGIIICRQAWHEAFCALGIPFDLDTEKKSSVFVVQNDDDDEDLDEDDDDGGDDEDFAGGNGKGIETGDGTGDGDDVLDEDDGYGSGNIEIAHGAKKRRNPKKLTKPQKDTTEVEVGDHHIKKEPIVEDSGRKNKPKRKSFWMRNSSTSNVDVSVAAFGESDAAVNGDDRIQCALCHGILADHIIMVPCKHMLCSRCFDTMKELALKQGENNSWAKAIASCCPSKPNEEYWKSSTTQCPFCGRRCEAWRSGEESELNGDASGISANRDVMLRKLSEGMEKANEATKKIEKEVELLLKEVEFQEMQRLCDTVEDCFRAECQRILEYVKSEKKNAEKRCRDKFESGLDEMVEERYIKLRRIQKDDSSSPSADENLIAKCGGPEIFSQKVSAIVDVFEDDKYFRNAERMVDDTVNQLGGTTEAACVLVQQIGNFTFTLP